MIFLGDLACPAEKIEAFNEAIDNLDILSDQVVVVNLEAVILRDGDASADKLYNHPEVLSSLCKKARKVIVSLANNHMYDYPAEILNTKTYLEERGVGVFGLRDADGTIKPYEYDDADGQVALFGHCWNLYSATNPNRHNDVRIVDVPYERFLRAVSDYVEDNPSRKVYCFMHWNYDLEIYPFPMHLKFAHGLIDAGVSGVIGSHSHIPHFAEIYRNTPIVYGLGNFYLPSGIYFNGTLTYPEESKTGLGIMISDCGAEILRFDTDTTCPVILKSVTHIAESNNAWPDTADHNRYYSFFKRNRAKRFLVPIFTEYSGVGFELKNCWAIWRIKFIKLILNLIHK